MSSHDETIPPGEEPEPSEEEMTADFAEVKKLLAVRPEDPEESRRITKETIRFFEKHRRRLERRDVGVEDILARLMKGRDAHDESCRKVDEAEEKLLHAGANLAESMAELGESMIATMHELHETWDDMDYSTQEQMREIIEDYMESREGYLAAMPIDERMRLEALYPQWW